ncbi:MAG: hypothetical protein ABEJ40_02835 [Haloarculaceae archaeon]
MNMQADDVAVEYPVVTTVAVAVVATVVYVGIQLVLEGSVAVAETATFVLVFSLVYVGGTYYLRQRAAGNDSGGGSGDGG